MNVPALLGSSPTVVLTREDASPRVQRSGSPGGAARKLGAAGQVRSPRPAPADAPRTPRHAPRSGGSLGPARAGAQKPGPRRPPPSRATHERAPRAAAAPAARAVARRRAASSAAWLRLQPAPAAAARPGTAPTRSAPRLLASAPTGPTPCAPAPFIGRCPESPRPWNSAHAHWPTGQAPPRALRPRPLARLLARLARCCRARASVLGEQLTGGREREAPACGGLAGVGGKVEVTLGVTRALRVWTLSPASSHPAWPPDGRHSAAKPWGRT